MVISFTITDSTRHRFAGYSIGICGKYGDRSFCARNPMVIQGSDDVIGSILRDLDFSTAVMDGTSFQIYLFAFDPRQIRYEEIKLYYMKHGLFFEERDGFSFLGSYDIPFSKTSMIAEGESHFIFKSHNQNGKHLMKFTFYYMVLMPDEHRNVYHDRGMDGKNGTLYYISNPMIEFSLNDL
jgi:hypothetical protein